jgi:hypothetical protein
VSPDLGRNDACHCGSGQKYKRCCLDTDRGASPPETDDDTAPPGYLTLLVETRAGIFVRHVPPASPLRQGVSQGHAAEQATQDAAAMWGMPDFVYRAELRKLESGSRELGDGIIIVGDLGIVIQVKSRVALSNDEDKERRWIEKQSTKALDQANGTIRQLKLQPAQVTNARGRTITVDGNTLRWLACAVIDHPKPPAAAYPSVDGCPHPSVVLLRRDWDFLFEQLKSTHAIGAYLERVAGEAVELGREPARYFENASADEQTPPDDIDPALLGPAGRKVSAPSLPMQPAAAEDLPAHRMVRVVLEDIAIAPLDDAREAERLKILAELDRLPIAYRGTMGQLMLAALDEIADVPASEVRWRFRRLQGELSHGRFIHLGFGVCSTLVPNHQEVFGSWVQLRHHDLQEVIGDSDTLMTVGVLLTPRRDGRRQWDTTMSAVSGPINLTSRHLALYRKTWKGQE